MDGPNVVVAVDKWVDGWTDDLMDEWILEVKTNKQKNLFWILLLFWTWTEVCGFKTELESCENHPNFLMYETGCESCAPSVMMCWMLIGCQWANYVAEQVKEVLLSLNCRNSTWSRFHFFSQCYCNSLWSKHWQKLWEKWIFTTGSLQKMPTNCCQMGFNGEHGVKSRLYTDITPWAFIRAWSSTSHRQRKEEISMTLHDRIVKIV